MKINLTCLFIVLCTIYSGWVSAQNCGPANTIYGINSGQRMLVSIDTATGVATDIGDIFAGGNAATDPSPGTSAIAIDPTTGIVWFATRVPGNIYSYKPGAANPYGTTTAAFGFSGTINKAAYNPADGKLYFHVGQNTNTLYRFDPSTPNTAPVLVGSLGLAGTSTTAANFSGGDIAFDGLGNLTGVLNNLNALAIFPAIYDANGNYQGIDLAQGVVLASFSAQPASVAFLPSGDYLAGGAAAFGVVRVNTNTAAQTTLSAFATSDFASCAAPVPNVRVSQTATSSCTGVNQITLTYTIKVQNTGKFSAINTRIFDQVPAGLTITGATLNGTSIPGANNALFNTGNGPLISSTGASAFQNGVLERGDSAIIVLTATATPGTYSNQAGIHYTGVEKLNLPNDRVASDNPATTTANDPTVITGGCSSLAGTVFNDANGMNNNTVDGTGTGIPGGTQLYLNLVNAGGVIIATVPVNSNGTYSILNIPNGSFTAQLSSIQGEVGVSAPLQTLPAGWIPTGESFAGVNDATVGNGLALTVNGNTTNANFGIERLPESYAVSKSVTGSPSLTNLSSHPLQGSDPEDQSTQGSWSTKTIVIDTLPTNGYILKYNGVAVTAGTPITNYNPALLTIEPGASSGGTSTTTFKYATIDAAGKKDPSPASYTINWSIPLPVQLRNFSGSANKDCSITLNWNTGKEEHLENFALQRSNDGINYETIAVQPAKGSYSSYRYIDKMAGAAQALYYRLYMKEQYGAEAYSHIVVVGINCATSITVHPNPASDKVNILGLTGQTTLTVMSMEGKIMQQNILYKESASLNISMLPAGTYYFIFTAGGVVQTLKVSKEK